MLPANAETALVWLRLRCSVGQVGNLRTDCQIGPAGRQPGRLPARPKHGATRFHDIGSSVAQRCTNMHKNEPKTHFPNEPKLTPTRLKQNRLQIYRSQPHVARPLLAAAPRFVSVLPRQLRRTRPPKAESSPRRGSTETNLRTPDVAAHFPGIEENWLTQPIGNRCGKPGGTDDRFLSSVRLFAAWRGLDRPRKTMVCPTPGSPKPAQPEFHHFRSSESRRCRRKRLAKAPAPRGSYNPTS
jgi:hypothetical protein